MTLVNAHQLEVTRKKLRLLEDRVAAIREAPTDNEHTKDLTLRSLKRLINQLTEEIARYEAKSPA